MIGKESANAMQENKIKSPLNYTGNKYRILPQIQKYFPQKIDTMVDLFCGGATVGINTDCNKIIFIDKDERVIGLLKFLASSNYKNLLLSLEKIIEKYGLSYSAKNGVSFYKEKLTNKNTNNGFKEYNSNGYYKLRDDYNKLQNKNTDAANTMLYMLMVYGFNNDLRFSKNGDFNLPVGKTDLNRFNIDKLSNYIERVNQIKAEFICGDFRDEQVKEIIESADFVYMDPPYLIMDAVYNENGQWNSNDESDLLNLLTHFLETNKSFVLSNVIEKKDQKNEPLCLWAEENKEKIKIVDIEYHYRSASYNKKIRNANEREVIIIPRELYDQNK